MRFRVLTFLSLIGICLIAVARADSPSTQPTTQASATTQPVDISASIHDLAKKIRQIGEEEEKLPKVAYFDLNKKIVEKPACRGRERRMRRLRRIFTHLVHTTCEGNARRETKNKKRPFSRY